MRLYILIIFIIRFISSLRYMKTSISHLKYLFHQNKIQFKYYNRMSSSNIEVNENFNRITQQAITWCGINGLMYTDGKLNWCHAPIALTPNVFPRKSFIELQNIQSLFNELIDRVSRNKAFIIKELEEVRKHDEFTNCLLSIYEKQEENDILSSTQLGLHRSDYMFNSDINSLETPLQIEINTIASSFGSLSQKVSQLHKYLFTRNNNSKEFKLLIENQGITNKMSLIENNSLKMLALGIAEAHKLQLLSLPNAIVLFVVQPNERNLADQRLLEQELWLSYDIRVEFVTLKDLENKTQVDNNNNLIYNFDNDSLPISVVYYRSGYSPSDYTNDLEWKGREKVELSNAIKCPTIGYQLAGTKKIQQSLYDPLKLKIFLENEEEILRLRKHFAKQYALDANSIRESTSAIQNAITDGSNWVLKPQREGGGNNMYGNELSNYLKNNEKSPTLGGYILMQRIFPKSQKSYFLRNGNIQLLESISEIGIYGIYLRDGKNDHTIINKEAGYLLRTKPSGVDEGGVATGYSVLSSIAILDEEI